MVYQDHRHHLLLNSDPPESIFLTNTTKRRKDNMSEFSLTPTTSKKIHHFPSLLLFDFSLFCSFILSHPLYFSYFILFSPYLLKLLSFLSPLFITTFLLLLALLTISPTLVHDYTSSTELPDSKPSFVLSTYNAVIEKLRSKVEHGDEQFHQYVELEAYKIVFEASSLDLRENPVQVLEVESKDQCLASNDDHAKVGKSSSQQSYDFGVSDELTHNEDVAENKRPESCQLIAEVKTSGGFLPEKEELEGLWSEKEEKEKEVKPLSVKSNKVEGQRQRGQAAMGSGSEGIGHRKSETKKSGSFGGEECYYSPKSNDSQRVEEAHLWGSPNNGRDYYNSKGENSPSLGSCGSKRREKEWRRTLACKLFEERHNADGGEGMDLLWEAYETDSVKSQGKLSTASKKGKSKFGSSRSELSWDYSEEEEVNDDGKPCCLQALKFSAGKMNLGMGRPNLVKISKALKGIGWLHHVSKHGKKGCR